MDTDFWVIMATCGQFRVSEATADRVRQVVAQYAGKPYQENQEIEFIDLAGSLSVIVVASYLGILESTAEQRRWDRQMNAKLDEEKEQDDPSWK